VKILEPLYDAVTFIMLAFHSLFKSLGVPASSGLAWGGSIVGLVIVIRILLIPLFVKQINAQRGLQMLQPEMKKLQAKYKGKSDPESKKKQQEEMMKLYKDNGTNPLASCLPIVLQAPIFFTLFRVLNGIGHHPHPITRGLISTKEASQAAAAQIFGANISDKFIGASSLTVQIVCGVMIVAMSGTTFLTQKQLMSKNMPASAMDNPFAQQQKILLYVFPLIFAVSGVNFPVGVLLYWLTTNVWTMCQQFYVIRRNPAPGSPAFDALEKRKADKAARTKLEEAAAATEALGTTTATAVEEPDVATGTDGPQRTPRQRQQPRRQPKRKR
jgi:YidC/Oxa1 family membrane protein insertase